MTADNPAARVDLDALRLTEAERVALFTAAKAEWLPPMGRDPLELAVERILADRLAPLLAEKGEFVRVDTAEKYRLRAETAEAERDEARAERAQAWDHGYEVGVADMMTDRDTTPNPYRAALADPEAS